MSYSKKPNNFIKSLQIIHAVMILGVVGFAVYVTISNKESLLFSYEEDKAFLYLAIIISFLGNLSSKYLYVKLIKQIPLNVDLAQKAVKYIKAHIFRVAMLVFPALMCVIFVMESNNSFYFLLVGILVLMILAIYPTKNKFENDVQLSSK